jgi:hypothetical protein
MPGGGAAQGHPFPQSTGTRYRTPAPEAHNARGEGLRSTETILHRTRAAKANQFLLGRTLDPLRTRSARRASGSSSNGDIGNYNAAGLALAVIPPYSDGAEAMFPAVFKNPRASASDGVCPQAFSFPDFLERYGSAAQVSRNPTR